MCDRALAEQRAHRRGRGQQRGEVGIVLGGDTGAAGRPERRDRRAPDFPLIAPEARGAQILLAGANFGCGSSREHAAWALTDWGFRAIVARSFADIFRENALKNGILPVALDAAAHAALVAARSARADLVLQVDLVAQRVTVAGDPDASFGFAIDPFARSCLVHGVDELGYLLGFEPRITAYEQRH